MSHRPRPLLVFEGDCGFCRGWIARWRRVTGDAVEYAPWQAVATRFPQIPVQRFRDSVVLVHPDGRTWFGAEAVFRSLAEAEGGGLGLWLYQHALGFAPVSEAVYRVVASHRDTFTALTRLLWGEHVVPPGERVTSWVFLRLLALVYLAAFVSLGVQIVGLVGRDGILPVARTLEFVAERYGPERFWLMPTLCWWNAGDAFLSAQCWIGAAAAVALLLGLLPLPMTVLLWGLYLSISTAGQEFLWFQWDSLLLEAGFLAILLTPWTWRSSVRRDARPRHGAVWMLRWLLFRVMFCSAAVKLSSGDPTWRSLTALRFHYETQPLPPWTAWYAHHLSPGFQSLSAAVMFALEGLVPFLAFAPRVPRIAGALAIAAFQGLIIVTGNYGFFNVLTLALCVLLLDDAVWPAWLRRAAGDGPREPVGRPPAWLARPVVVVLFALSLVPLTRSLGRPAPWTDPLIGPYRLVSPLHVVNPYGLFAVMTTSRPEIVVEGSDDGVTWKPYEFRWKPGDVQRRPAFMAPHMPRLDWQMWFAALDTTRPEPWFLSFCHRLLEGSKPVLRLLARDPFAGRPPRLLRALVYDYHFTDAATRRETGAWWRRELKGSYVPALTLVDGRLTPVEFGPGAP